MASETACTYACLILHDEGIAITAEKIAILVKAASVNVESYWPSLFAKFCSKKNIEDLLMNVGVGGGGASPAAVSAPVAGSDVPSAPAAPAAEEKKEELKEESDDEPLFSLFD